MIEVIRRSGILAEFPGRTATDLYLFVMDHLHHLREQYRNQGVPPDVAVEDFEQTQIPPKPPGWWRGWWRGMRGRFGASTRD
jgi:hypothetical protein